ncbi:cilia- and flagella-associated protein 251-like [Corticium candelabrum]|uniref:cilia- and flagella-associated protein 251-like n=1 Tax=Corticium candelabrum TaxID=121492 RepID=UPI002E260419|nr:cilia- and flagella-associated protein 251-like [Corticium candelabrum]
MATANDSVSTDVEITNTSGLHHTQSAVATAQSGASLGLTHHEEEGRTSALKLTWTFGLNKSVAVHNISDSNRKMIFYVAAHTGILYDYTENRESLLQGHSSIITCTCVSGNKRWLATADQGNDSMVIIWDSYTGIPVQTLFSPHHGGVAAMTMARDAKLLATIGAVFPQALSVWDWLSSDQPLYTVVVSPDYGLQMHVSFCDDDNHLLISNSTHQVIFYSSESGSLQYCAPVLDDKTFNKVVGTFSQSVFVPSTTRAMTATSIGNVVVWDHARPEGPGAPAVTGNPMMKRPLKMIHLQQSSITVMTLIDDNVVTGDSDGHVKFYDGKMRLKNWWDDLNSGPVAAISFACSTKSDILDGSNYPSSATIKAKPFVTPDFTVATSDATILNVTVDGNKKHLIHHEHSRDIHALAAYPFKPWLLIGSYSGLLKLWDYDKKVVLATRQFEKHQCVQCVTFDQKGKFVAVGFTNGTLQVVNFLTLEDECLPFKFSRDCITHVSFSYDCKYLATADIDLCVTVFKATSDQDQPPYQYVGKHRAHYKQIRGILFGNSLDTDEPILMSVGEDRLLVVYDLVNSSENDLRLLSSDRIEQSAVSNCIDWYPSVTKETFLVTANNQFKFKLYNSTTKMCRKTVLAPTYSTPIQRMAVLPSTKKEIPGEETRRYLMFITKNQVGLCLIPLDGNPFGNMALTAHPGQVTNVVHSHDGKILFTCGGSDAAVNMWIVNTDALEAGALLGGEGLVPFYSLLDGGQDGELFAEMEDYFYYAQLRHQGIDSMETRQVSDKVPLEEVPNIMRALGFFPSEQEIEDMQNEVKFSRYVSTGQYTTELDLGDIIQLYVNHRPTFGVNFTRLHQAFDVLGQRKADTLVLDRGRLLNLLQSKGEHITEAELADCLGALLGYTADGVDVEPPEAVVQLEEQLPEDITTQLFAENVLGFPCSSLT